MKLLLHICCAPCSTAAVEAWRQEGVRVTGTFFNPNIHPFAEHSLRWQTLLSCAGAMGLPLMGGPEYDITGWLRRLKGGGQRPERCRICISQRLGHTARLAAGSGFGAFSTTLLVSPYQEHEIIREEGEKAAEAAGVRFAYRDLRARYRRSIELSREAGLYRQKYCGCIYSDAEAAAGRRQRAGERAFPPGSSDAAEAAAGRRPKRQA